MRPAILYHWWGEKEDPPPYANLRAPILISIATFRYRNPYIPIFVLDISETPQDWHYYPKLLNFNVVPWTPHLSHYSYRPGWKHLSRLYDVAEFGSRLDEDQIMYVDSDAFCLKEVFPTAFQEDGFCFNNWNSGFFYYNKNHSFRFFEIFKSFTMTALNDDNFRFFTRQFLPYNDWYYIADESILTYMYNKHRTLFKTVPIEEHLTAREIAKIDVTQAKVFHANGLMVNNEVTTVPGQREHSRGLLGLVIAEFWEALEKNLGPVHLAKLFTPEEIAYYQPMRVSFTDPEFVKRLLASKSESGHYHLGPAIKKASQEVC